MWLRIVRNDGLLWKRWRTVGFRNKNGIFLIIAELVAYEDSFYFTDCEVRVPEIFMWYSVFSFYRFLTCRQPTAHPQLHERSELEVS